MKIFDLLDDNGFDKGAQPNTSVSYNHTPQGQPNATGQLQMKPITPVVNQQQSNGLINQHEGQAVIGNVQNDILKGMIDTKQGVQEAKTRTEQIQQMLGMTTPKMDEVKAERLKKIAAVNSVGQALSTAFGGYIGTKGGPILNTQTDITPKALADYKTMVANDKENKYRTNMLKVQESIRGLHDIAQIENENKKYNQAIKTQAMQAVSKFNLEKYNRDEAYRLKMDEIANKNGFEWKVMLKKNEFDEKKAKEAAANQVKIAQMHEGGANARQAASLAESKRLYPNGKGSGQNTYGISGITFQNKSTKENVNLTGEQVGAIIDAVRYDTSPASYQARKVIASAVNSKGQYSMDYLKTILPTLFEQYGYAIVNKNGGQSQSSSFGNTEGVTEGNSF